MTNPLSGSGSDMTSGSKTETVGDGVVRLDELDIPELRPERGSSGASRSIGDSSEGSPTIDMASERSPELLKSVSWELTGRCYPLRYGAGSS